MSYVDSFVSNYVEEDTNKVFKVVHLPTATLFGRSEARKSENKRATNNMVALTQENLYGHIQHCHQVLKKKEVYVKQGSDRKSKSMVLPLLVSLDVAVVVKEVIEDVEENDKKPAATTKPSPSKGKKKSSLYIPRMLHIGVLNPVMTEKKDSGIQFLSSSAAAIGTIELDISQYILNDFDLDSGEFI